MMENVVQNSRQEHKNNISLDCTYLVILVNKLGLAFDISVIWAKWCETGVVFVLMSIVNIKKIA